MRKNAAVVDASALAALLFGEPPGPNVASRLGGKRLFAPSLLRYELANVCSRKIQTAPGKEKILLSALDLFYDLGIQEVQIPPGELIPIAQATGLTAYDAAYLWLARELGAELVTLDHELDKTTGLP
jgi:predicted nucleic acid-binding protein